jgi:signal transduction histidine kinase
MFSGLRLRLTLLYALAAMALVVLVGGGAYLVVARYFASITDLALQHKMAHEFHTLAAPLPPDLAHADRDWSLVRDELALLPRPPAASGGEREDHDDDDEGARSEAPAVADSELAAIYVLPLDASGRILYRPSGAAALLAADTGALSAALTAGSDLRTVSLPDGQRVRLLTYRLTRLDGPAALQLGRELGDQEQVLRQLMGGLLGLGTLSIALVGAASWWIAGRALRPAQAAWDRQQRFIASASHELRTPLTLIRASAEVALRGAPPGDMDQRALLGDVLSESDHMRRLVDDLLTLSRLDSGRLPLSSDIVDLSALLAEAQRQIARLGDERGIAVLTGTAAGAVLADPERLRQVLLILLDNALRHTPPGGTITLGAAPDGRLTRIWVADTGCGIAPEHLPHLFERFYRADSAHGRAGGNAGLGLAIAQALVTAMGGRITIESAPGRGTTASIFLPAAPAG